jgi:hypothetical protein
VPAARIGSDSGVSAILKRFSAVPSGRCHCEPRDRSPLHQAGNRLCEPKAPTGIEPV